MDFAEFAHELERLEIPPPPPPIMNFDGTGPRLLITKIVNENFKSYFGRHILGPFHKNFTSIVGPNGSGKSNVIDSLLFVFGYRAQRIRSKNISVLIHNSEQHRDVGNCTVEVHFVKIIDKTEDEYDVVPNSAFVIGRTAYKDNSSIYYINNKRVQFKDVGVMLRQHGIDIDHNRFLILQGEVEQISLMKPKALAEGEEGMLEYLEDIIGSSRLKPCLEKLHSRMEQLNEMRSEKIQHVKAVEEEKTQLEGPKDEAVAFLELENRVTRKKNLLYQKYLYEASQACTTVEKEMIAVKEAFDVKEKQLGNLCEELKVKQKNYNKLKKKHDDLQAESESCIAGFRELEKADVRLREDVKQRKGRQTTLQSNKASEEKKLDDLKQQPEKCAQQLEELKSNLGKLETKRTELDEKLEEGMRKLRDETKAALAEKKVLEEQLIARQEGVAAAREKLNLAKAELELCLSAQTREQTKLTGLRETLANLVQSVEECTKKISDAEVEIPEMEKNLRQIDSRLKEITAEEKTLNEQIREKSARVGIATASLQSSGNRSRVLDALFNQQRRGNLRGIFGRLGDLGAIDEKYDVAISTACGPLDNIVVDTIDTAQRCVEFLTQNNVGMATFIALDKMNRFEQTMRQPFRTPENVARLFDLIVVEDQRVLPAFYYALRDTLVAKDLDQASRVAFQGDRAKYRVVTLTGEIIDVSGTMSGGGTRQSRGRMGREVVSTPGDDMTPEQLQNLEAELARLKTRSDQLRTLRMQLETERDRLGPSLQNKKIDLNSWKMDIKAWNERKQAVENQIKAQERTLAATVPDEEEKQRLTSQIEVFQKDYDKVHGKSAVIEQEVKKVDVVIKEITERCVGCIQKEIEKCRREISDTEKAIGKAKVAVRSAERNIKNSEEKLANLEEEIESNNAILEKNMARLQELEKDGAELVVRRDQALKEMETFTSDVQNAKKELTTLEEQEQTLQTGLIDQKARFNHVEQTLKNFQQKKNYWEKEVKKLELHNIVELCGLDPSEMKDAGEKVEKENADGENEEREQQEEQEQDEEEEQDKDERGELRVYPDEVLEGKEQKKLEFQLVVLEDRLKTMKPNLDILNEYQKKALKHRKCLSQLEDVTKMRDQYRNRYEELRKQRLNEFMDGFIIISSKLKEMYQMITLGGDADLELVDTMDPFTEGIAFSVRPPKKSWKQISNLSGGEKTLSSLSLVFALHHYKPTPLYVMDEIDAALDFRNVSIVANYIKERTKNAQFIIISLRNNMFELADRLIGIYKTNNCTKSVVVNPTQISLPSLVRVPMQNHHSTPPRNVLQDRSFSVDINPTLPNANGSVAVEPVASNTDQLKLTPSQA